MDIQFDEIEEFQDLYLKLAQIGCEVEFAPLRIPVDVPITVETHRQAILFALQLMQKRCDQLKQRLYEAYDYQERFKPAHHQLAVHAHLLDAPLAMSRQQFLGQACDLEQRRLVLKSQGKQFPLWAFWFGDDEIPKNRIALESLYGDEPSFTGIFCEPEHGLNGENAKINSAYFETIDCLFNGMHGEQDIYAWNPDCAEYLNHDDHRAQRYLWTFHQRDSDRIIVILMVSGD